MKRINIHSPRFSQCHAAVAVVLAVLWAMPMCLCPHCFTTTFGLANVAEAQAEDASHSCCHKPDSQDSTPAPADAPSDSDCHCQWDTPTRGEEMQPAVITQAPASPLAFPPTLLAFETVDTDSPFRMSAYWLNDDDGPPGSPSPVADHVLLLI